MIFHTGDEKVAQILLDGGDDITSKSYQNNNALHLAANRGTVVFAIPATLYIPFELN